MLFSEVKMKLCDPSFDFHSFFTSLPAAEMDLFNKLADEENQQHLEGGEFEHVTRSFQNRRSKTFFDGLKENRSSQVKHLAIYFIRRICFAICLVFYNRVPLYSILVLMTSSLAMLMLLFHDNQWEESLIRWQHIVNELTLYVICL